MNQLEFLINDKLYKVNSSNELLNIVKEVLQSYPLEDNFTFDIEQVHHLPF